jgi:hypothetical protein
MQFYEKIFNENVIQRFLGNLIDTGNGCIEYKCLKPDGYGRISIGTRVDRVEIKAHRWAFMFAHGIDSLPSVLFVCHSCDNPACVNPYHLFLGDAYINNLDKKLKGRCPVVFGNSKINWDIVDFIRSNDLPYKQFQEMFGISKATVSEVKNHVIWQEDNRFKSILPQ